MGKGGSRYGAGRPGYRIKAEHTNRVEIGRWQREGRLRAGNAFSWTWNRGGEPCGSIGVVMVDEHALRLAYSISSGETRRDASQFVRIVRTPCPFGSARPWFSCPVCTRRVGVLFLRSGRFACRHCQRVAYASQSEDGLGRMWRRQSKLEARLGDDWTRPKGMRQHTYARLLDRLQDCVERRDAAFCEVAARMFGFGDVDRMTKAADT